MPDQAPFTGAYGQPRVLSEAELRSINVDNKGVRFLMSCLACELQEASTFGDVTHLTVKDQLSLVFGELNRNLGDLLDIRSVSTGDAASLASLSIRFSYPLYRLVAEAAKNRAADIVDGD
ncbi:hypothetical protein PhaeoP75_01802 [Phaeobacter gallaeciensis]|uniref:Uncharacterized protein n=1 Tax=Phaeobacter gallaeciensis TaxID=60890 RepID=A0AAD0ECW8_9RHOB|nr:hypothetical protein Gal_01759 [Phaeobacter gallaeciensis DSM 26640]ATE92780.1 hypothetical protein PhaeoP11_01752 [Phaeobacter gallaeciensis]ATE97398.1 hypothetical protein PhaeoP73_02094 [Phaeobacter gallaeciensis]ATF01445.1 hypothetical protein PhaeoP75_01802 [Phaeobacter gallaeciensis]ATF05825.1 hypothetical protein PhaeoP63_01750 [Phaeobacter gallaeciensis]